MKKLFVLAVALVSAAAFGQYGQRENSVFVTVGFDPRNVIVGSGPTDYKSAIDFHAKLGARNGMVEVALLYENFSDIDFQKYGVQINIVNEILKDIDIAAGIELGSIIRMGNSNFLTVGGNIETRYSVAENVSIGLQHNLQYRGDLVVLYDSNKKWVFSNYINIIFKFNR